MAWPARRHKAATIENRPITTSNRGKGAKATAEMPALAAPLRGEFVGSLISLQLPLSPMRVFAIGIEHALDVPVERRQYAKPPLSRDRLLISSDQARFEQA